MEEYTFHSAPLPGAQSWQLINNPDRGLRMENHFNPYNCTGFPGTQRNMDGFELLKNNISKYAEESPRLTQLYIYLIDYYDQDLDFKAIANLQKYFRILEENNVKALLIFAYEYDVNGATGPTTEQILRHIEQLKPFLKQYRDSIHTLQAGFIGLWGEWHHPIHPHVKETILNAILDARPDDLFVQIRMVDFKNVLNETDDRRRWIGYADMYLVGFDHRWSISLFPETPQYQQVLQECSELLMDGEMPWGSDTTEVQNIDGMLMAKRLQAQHFTSLSLEHNYRESGYFVDYAMKRWQTQMVYEKLLKEEGLRVAPGWFKNQYGKNVSRSLFEYIRDHLGYLIMVNEGKVSIEEDKATVHISLVNYGFSAPLGMKKMELVLLDADSKVVDVRDVCHMEALQPEVPVHFQTTFLMSPKLLQKGAEVGIRFVNSGGPPARLYNDVPYEGGIHRYISLDMGSFVQAIL